MKRILILFLACIGSLSCGKQAPPVTINDFHILYSQDPSLAAVVNQKEWKSVSTLLFIDLPYSSPDRFSHAWIRGSVTVDDHEKWYGLYLNTQYLENTVYINTTAVGTKSLQYINAIDFSKPDLYRIPPGVLKKGGNDIYIRIGSFGTIKGSIRSTVELETREGYEHRRFWNDFWYYRIFIGMIIMFSSLLAVQVMTYLIDRKIKIRLWSSLGILYTLVLLVMLFIPFTTENSSFMVTFYLVSIPVIMLYLLFLIQIIYGIFLSNLNRWLIPLYVSGALLLCLTNNNYVVQSLLVVAAMLAGFGGLGYMLFRLNRIKPKRFFFYLVIFEFILICITNLWQALSIPLELSIPCPDYLTLYLGLVYIFAGIVYEAIEVKKQGLRLERLYDRLKEPAPAKTARLTITDSSEEKLERVIEFINENYTSDLSREALAAAVDLNPNYLSSLFNAYTGKKFNEYINSLRIKDAARQISSTDQKIIDIAFAVGFESLSTFIRVFKNETGKTPSDYREGMNG